jgi:hypothetical protein
MDEASASSKTGVPTNFLSLPRELRNQIYVYVLVDEDYINLGTLYYPRPLSPQLLRTNKTIHNEATEVLYSLNRFDFAMYDPNLLSLFLDKIGPNNLNYIRHIRIDFPTFQYLDPGDVTLTDESVRILEKLKDCCGNLKTLTTSRSSTNHMERRLDDLEHPKVVSEALKLVDARFRAISSLREKPPLDHDSGYPVLSIIVEVYKDGLNDDIRREMESHGWILDTAEDVEEEDYNRSFSDIDYDDIGWDRDDGDDYDDDYDIDNDSDFWRRAGD